VRLLLDTHVLLWLLAGSERVSDEVREVLADPRNEVFVSAASGWEIAIKVGLGKLDVPPDVRSWLPVELTASRLTILPISLDHALGVENLPAHHADPFDRVLIAQALAEDMVLVSNDHQIDRYEIRLMHC
jgi:PIN domain nuclease of toxin-antitoxin system